MNTKKTVKLKPTKKRYLFPMGIAASLLLILSIYFNKEPVFQEVTVEEVSIIAAEPEEMNTQSLLSNDETSIYAWEAPTSSLIEEFK